MKRCPTAPVAPRTPTGIFWVIGLSESHARPFASPRAGDLIVDRARGATRGPRMTRTRARIQAHGHHALRSPGARAGGGQAARPLRHAQRAEPRPPLSGGGACAAHALPAGP